MPDRHEATSGRRHVSPADAEFLTFYEQSYPEFAAVLLLMTGDLNEVHHVGAEAFTRARRSWRSIRRCDNPQREIYRLAAKVLQRRRAAPRAPCLDSWTRHPEDALVLRILNSLPDLGRQVLVLHYTTGLPLSDIARWVGLPTSDVKDLLGRTFTEFAQRVPYPEDEEAGGEYDRSGSGLGDAPVEYVWTAVFLAESVHRLAADVSVPPRVEQTFAGRLVTQRRPLAASLGLASLVAGLVLAIGVAPGESAVGTVVPGSGPQQAPASGTGVPPAQVAGPGAPGAASSRRPSTVRPVSRNAAFSEQRPIAAAPSTITVSPTTSAARAAPAPATPTTVVATSTPATATPTSAEAAARSGDEAEHRVTDDPTTTSTTATSTRAPVTKPSDDDDDPTSGPIASTTSTTAASTTATTPSTPSTRPDTPTEVSATTAVPTSTASGAAGRPAE